MRESDAILAVAAGLFNGNLAEAMEYGCDCAKFLYRNNPDGSREYKLKGESNCLKCRGTGSHRGCETCGGCGMVPGSQVCSSCHGSGRVPIREAPKAFVYA